MYGGPSEIELSKAGLTLADMEEDRVWQWPENVEACDLFQLFATQWRTGPGGASGWDYGPAMLHMAAQRIKPRRQQVLIGQLRILESAALKCIQDRDD